MAAQEVRRFALPSALAAFIALFPAVQAQTQTARPIEQVPYGEAADRDWSGQVPAHLWIVDGDASIEREGRVEAARENMALLEGDRLRTERGRVDVLFEDGSSLAVDEFSRVDLLSDSLVRLLDGRIRLTIARAANILDYRVDSSAGSALIRGAGDYRIALSLRRAADPELQVGVLRGSAEIANDNGRTLVRAGYEAVATERRIPSAPYTINSASWDSFDRWVEDLRDSRLGTQSSNYLPADLRYYGGVFDRNGTWDYVPDYGGYAWYPTVPVGWRPYSTGSWSFYANFGWFWVGSGRWAWPTHHYGRWGLAGGRWYWVPGYKWSPAWVAWGGAPGYVSWCPLGYRGGPVVGFGGAHYANPWTAWTVVPSRVFVHNISVPNHVVGYTSIAPAVRGQFVTRASGPAIAVATPSRIAPLRAPTFVRGAVPRNGVDSRPIDPNVSRTRSRIPAAEPRAIDPPQAQPPRRVNVPEVQVPRLETPSLSTPQVPRAQPRTRVPQPDAAPRLESPTLDSPRTETRSRVSRLPDRPASQSVPRGGLTEGQRGPEHAITPMERNRPEPPSGARSRIPSSESTGSAPAARPRGELRSAEPSSAPRSQPSRVGSDNRSSAQPSTSTSSQSSGGRGQAVRRGGGT